MSVSLGNWKQSCVRRGPEELFTVNEPTFCWKLFTTSMKVECLPAVLMCTRSFRKQDSKELPPFHEGHSCKERLLFGGGSVFAQLAIPG